MLLCYYCRRGRCFDFCRLGNWGRAGNLAIGLDFIGGFFGGRLFSCFNLACFGMMGAALFSRYFRLPAIALGRGALGRGALGRGALGRGALGRGALGRGALGRGALGRGALGRGIGLDRGRGRGLFFCKGLSGFVSIGPDLLVVFVIVARALIANCLN